MGGRQDLFRWFVGLFRPYGVLSPVGGGNNGRYLDLSDGESDSVA